MSRKRKLKEEEEDMDTGSNLTGQDSMGRFSGTDMGSSISHAMGNRVEEGRGAAGSVASIPSLASGVERRAADLDSLISTGVGAGSLAGNSSLGTDILGLHSGGELTSPLQHDMEVSSLLSGHDKGSALSSVGALKPADFSPSYPPSRPQPPVQPPASLVSFPRTDNFTLVTGRTSMVTSVASIATGATEAITQVSEAPTEFTTSHLDASGPTLPSMTADDALSVPASGSVAYAPAAVPMQSVLGSAVRSDELQSSVPPMPEGSTVQNFSTVQSSSNQSITGASPMLVQVPSSIGQADDDHDDADHGDYVGFNYADYGGENSVPTPPPKAPGPSPAELAERLERKRLAAVEPLVTQQDMAEVTSVIGAASDVTGVVDEAAGMALEGLNIAETIAPGSQLTLRELIARGPEAVVPAAPLTQQASSQKPSQEKVKEAKEQKERDVRIAPQEKEKSLADLLKRKYTDTERVSEEVQRYKRKEQAKELMSSITAAIRTSTSFALATPETPRHPRLVKPNPSLNKVIDYRPTQLELEWNRRLLSTVDWIGVRDVNLANPTIYGKEQITQPHLDERDRELLTRSIPYDKEDSREQWKGKGRVPIFTVRPAYTEIGLRQQKKKARREVVEDQLRFTKESKLREEGEEERRQRFARGVQMTFSVAQTIDDLWRPVLMEVSEAIGLGYNEDPDALVLRQQTLSMAGYCSDQSLSSLDDVFLSVAPGASPEEIKATMLVPGHKEASTTTPDDLAEWQEAWHMWGELYAQELRASGVTASERDMRLRNDGRRSIEEILKGNRSATMLNARGESVKNELLHPTDRKANIVSVKTLMAEDDPVRKEQDLVVAHFPTGDPLPADKLTPPGVDFFELPNREQLRLRHSAPDHLYEGSMLWWKRASDGDITADFLMPEDYSGHVQAGLPGLQDKELVNASWWAPRMSDGTRGTVVYDHINAYDGKLATERESNFIFREMPLAVKVSYPARKLILHLAPDSAEAQDLHEKLLKAKLNVDERERRSRGRKAQKYVFNWMEDLEQWEREDEESGRADAFLKAVRERLKDHTGKGREPDEMEQGVEEIASFPPALQRVKDEDDFDFAEEDGGEDPRGSPRQEADDPVGDAIDDATGDATDVWDE